MSHVCGFCGKTEDERYSHSAELEQKKLCFTCHFWFEKVAIKDKPNVIRCKGSHMMIGSRLVKDGLNGSGGRKHIITMLDGTERTTVDLWHQGKIPEHFQSLLPDNALKIVSS